MLLKQTGNWIVVQERKLVAQQRLMEQLDVNLKGSRPWDEIIFSTILDPGVFKQEINEQRVKTQGDEGLP